MQSGLVVFAHLVHLVVFFCRPVAIAFALLLQNAALFWYNYDGTGSIDLKSLHAGCPVLLGEKWSKLCVLTYFSKLYIKI